MKRIFLLMIGALGSLLPAMAQETQDHDFETSKNLEIFNAIYRNLDMAYVDTLSAGQTIGTGIQAMLQSLDPYTVYYPAEKVNELKSTLTGKYAGIGALIRYNSKEKHLLQ